MLFIINFDKLKSILNSTVLINIRGTNWKYSILSQMISREQNNVFKERIQRSCKDIAHAFSLKSVKFFKCVGVILCMFCPGPFWYVFELYNVDGYT